MRFAFIEKEAEHFSVETLCRVLEVTPQGYYRYLADPVGKRAAKRAARDKVVAEIFDAHEGRYGGPRVLRALRDEYGLPASKTQVEDSMQRLGLRAARPRAFVVTTRADESAAHAPNLLARDFTATQPNERWVTDISYLGTREGWVYLAVILDLYSRKVVGWSMGDTLETTLPLRALDMALAQRSKVQNVALMHHSDRGCQYTSTAYAERLRAEGIDVSMSRKGNCWDNAVAESFFATLKKELVYRQSWPTKSELETAVFEYIEVYYNRKRMHSALGYRTPEQVESEFTSRRHAA